MSRDDYVKAMADQHLSDRNTCEIIPKEEDQEYLVEDTSAFLEFVSQKGNDIDDKELTYIARSLDKFR